MNSQGRYKKATSRGLSWGTVRKRLKLSRRAFGLRQRVAAETLEKLATRRAAHPIAVARM